MIRQLIPLLIVSAIAIHAEPLRRRRQANDTAAASPSSTPQTLPVAIAVPCPVGCNVRLISAWAKAVSFEPPTPSMVDNPEIVSSNRTLDVMCSLFAEYRQCLTGCGASNDDYRAAIDATPTLSQVCIDKQAEIDNSAQCLSDNTPTFQQLCKTSNEELLAASVRLSVQQQLVPEVLRGYCKAANIQAFCVLPMVRQKCGDAPYNTIRSIINGTLIGIKTSISERAIHDFYPECSAYLDTISSGLGIGFENGELFNITTTSQPVSNTTTTMIDQTTTAVVYNTTSDNTTSLLRDDVNGPPYDPEGGRLAGISATPVQTTTSSAQRRSYQMTMVLSMCSVLFSIFV